MSFIETVHRAEDLLRQQGRISLRALTLEFDLDGERLDALVEELVDVRQVAVREGKVLTWAGREIGSASLGVAGERIDATRDEPAVSERAEPEAERRHLTVLFCDLVESTRLAASLDPEDWREVVRGYHEGVLGIIERFGGHVAQYLGDGLLVYFGWPKAHEDDAERAVRAALGVVDAVGERNALLEERHGLTLSVRIGIHTGPVVVGEMGGGERREMLAIGDTTNVSARLQSVAEPNTVVLSSATLRLVQWAFVTRDLGTRDLDGLGDVSVHRVVRASGVRSRLDAVAPTSLTPLVGRNQELMLLEDRWTLVQEGRGQAVLTSGEAGIGKSRLMQTFRERLIGEEHSWLECRASPYAQDSALYPLLELQREELGFSSDDPTDVKLERITAGLERAGIDLAPAVPLMAAFHSVPLSERYVEPALSPEGWRRETLRLLLEWLLRLERERPVVLLVEDLHWIDPSTLEFLGMVLEQAPQVRLLLMATHRPDFQPPWRGRAHVTPMLLSRLTRRQMGQLIRLTTRGRDLSDALVEEIARRADGVPLFAEELSRAVPESSPEAVGEGESPALRIPETLQDSLTARLDALGPAKAVAQLGAVFGREFSYELLVQASSLTEEQVRRALARAVRDELLYQRSAPPRSTYLFRHALVRDAAYQSLLRSTRQRHHLRVAETLIECTAETVEVQPELVAHHFTEGGDLPRAVEYWQRAGRRAIERSAHEEAVRHVSKGLAVLERLPDTPERSQHELGLQTLRGLGAAASEGYAAPEVEEAFARAGQLCEELGEGEALFPILFGRFVFYQLRADADAMRDLAKRMLALAERSGDPGLRVEGHLAMGQQHYWGGELLASRQHSERVLSLYDGERDREHAFVYGQDPAVWAHAVLGVVLWGLGRPADGLAHLDRCVALGEQLGHPFTAAGTATFVAAHYFFRRDAEECLAAAERMRSIALQQHFPMWIAASEIYTGWARSALCADGDQIERVRAGLAAWGGTGALRAHSQYLVMLAETCYRAGRVGEGLTAIEDALLHAQRHRERYWEAEIHRWKAELLLLDGADTSSAEVCLRKALDTASRQHAKLLELRAATSLARLWQSQGRLDAARDLLRPAYEWFTEGFDTSDVRSAKALLGELTQEPVPHPPTR